MMNLNAKYTFLDTDEDRQQLIAEIAAVRAAVREMAATIPESEWYTPRYHGWSLAAMLAHLNVADNFAMLTLRLALVGIHPRLGMGKLNWWNDFSSRIFKARLVPSTLQSMSKNEARIADFIQHVPMNRLSRTLYHPVVGALTVEHGIQEYFLYHWKGHLQTMREAEDLTQTRSDQL